MKRWIAMILIVVFCLSGCSMLGGSDILTMLSPPEGQNEYRGIREALQSHFSSGSANASEIIYTYPEQGEYRSSIILCDLNQDGKQEAIVFYRTKNIAFGLNVAFLTSNEKNEWKVLQVFSKINIQSVKQVSLVSMGTESQLEVVITYETYNSRMVEVYGWRKNEVRCFLEEQLYTEIGLFDFDYDGFEEFLLVHRPEDSWNMVAELYEMEAARFVLSSRTEWRSQMLSYKESLVGTLWQSEPSEHTRTVGGSLRGMVLEGYVDNETICSEVLYLKDHRLYLHADTEQLEHSIWDVPSDVDKDGVLEFPVSSPKSKDTVWYTRWMKGEGPDLQWELENITVHNYQQKYYLTWSVDWERKYKVQSNGNGSQLEVYCLRSSDGEILQDDLQEYAVDAKREDLLKICAISPEVWKEEKYGHYRTWFVLEEREDVVFVAKEFSGEMFSQGMYGASDWRGIFHEIT